MSFYTSLTGLNAASAQLGVTSNNIANVGTTGFKRSRADFGDIFATSPLQRAASTIGQGVALKQVSQEFSQGNIQSSGNSLDLAITGDGFFPLRSPDGLQDIYTRNGAFFLNEQNNVVNSAGQRLMAAQVDSSGKADLSQLRVLTIPPKTIGQARETTRIQLGLNLPADAPVINEPFNRNDPATYNKSTALTVYDGGGNGYLATVYYVKSSNPSPEFPEAKWQTYVFVGESRVEPSLMQAQDENGEKLFVNKYGDLKPESEVQEDLVSAKTPMFTLNQLRDLRVSLPAQASSFSSISDSLSRGGRLPEIEGGTFLISVDGSKDVLVNVPNITSDQESETSDLPENIAARLTVLINQAMGQPNLATTTPPVDDRRYGIQVRYDQATGKFNFLSGSTGDKSSITIKDASPSLANILGLAQVSTRPIQFTVDGESVALPVLSAPNEDKLVDKINDEIEKQLVSKGIEQTVTVAINNNNLEFTSTSDIDFTNTEDTEIKPGNVAFRIAGLFTAGDEIQFEVNGDNQTFTITSEQSLSAIASSINANPSYGVVASVSDSRLILTAKEPTENVQGTFVPNSPAVAAVAGDPVDGDEILRSDAEPGKVAFDIDFTTIVDDDVIKFTVGEGAEQTFTISGQTTLTALVDAISDDNSLTEVTASEIDGKLVLTVTGSTNGVSGTITDSTGDVILQGVSTPPQEAVGGKVQLNVSNITATDIIKFTVEGGAEQTFEVDNETSLQQIVDSINAKVDDGSLTGVEASVVDGKLVLTSTDPTLNVSGSFTDNTPEVAATPILGVATGSKNAYLLVSNDFEIKTAVSPIAERGKASLPAELRSEVLTVNTSSNISINDLNNTFSVTVDGVRASIRLDNGSNYTINQIVNQLQERINQVTDQNGRVIRGVKVEFDQVTRQLVFTTGTTGDNSSIRVTNPASEWGLRNADTARGTTSNWYSMRQFEELSDGQLRFQFIDERGNQTADSDGSQLPEWSPIFFDKGELSFDIRGRLKSPATPMLFNTVFLEGGRGALNVNIDFTQSTQFASPFAVLSQAQDGAPEGDLLGLDIGLDGLVNASFSNGSQQSLGKIVLANFASPTGLRQLGDASYLATAVSGGAKIGEPGSAGYGSIRAGATERSNVDLTQELVDLITAQRNFQANAKAIETSSTTTQAIINIRS
jgi:flagellar hook-basal body protein